MSITIEGAIAQYNKNADYCKRHGMNEAQEECKQLADLLRELQERRKAPEVIQCGECVNFAESGFCKVAGHNVHRKSNCMKVFGAKKNEETDD